MSNIYSDLNVPVDIKAPYPPKTTVGDLLSRNKKIPNAFIIYRTSLHHELRSKGYNLPLQQCSAMASNAWRNESEEVKKAYTKLYNDAKFRYNTLQDPVAENAEENYVHPHSSPPEFTIEDSNIVEAGNSVIAPELSLVDVLQERIRVLEERLILLAEWLGVQFR